MSARKLTEFVDAQVTVPLDEAEQRVAALDLAAVCAQIDEARALAKEDAAAHRQAIQTLESRQRELAERVRTGTRRENAQVDMFNRAPAAASAADELSADDDDDDDDAVPLASSLAVHAARSREELPRTVEDRAIDQIDKAKRKRSGAVEK